MVPGLVVSRNSTDRDIANAAVLFCSVIALCCFAISSPASAGGALDAKQARKIIANMAGLSLKTDAVHVKTIRPIDASTLEANAEIDTAFRLEKNVAEQWRVVEFRTGQDQWQGLEFVFRSLKFTKDASPCDAPDLAVAEKTVADPSLKRSRCLLADLLGVQLPSDDVRIKAVSPMVLPFSSKPSAMVEAFVAADFRLQKGANGSWRVAAVKTGDRNWIDPEVIMNGVNVEKAASARAELEALAKALEAFRGRRGFYVESKSQAILVDFLSPRYLSSVIRLDPWRRPYAYEGTKDHFTLRSLGPDGKENTSDDIVLSGPTHPAASQNIPK